MSPLGANAVARALADHGLAAVLVGTLLEGEGVLLAAGVLAERGLLRPVSVWLAASLGAWLGHLICFGVARLTVSRSRIRSAALRKPVAARIELVDRLVQRHPTASILALQYLYGLRIVGAFALGLTGISWRRFLVTEALNCPLWAALFTALGYVVGDFAAQAFGGGLRWIWAALSLGAVLAVLHVLSRRAAERLR